MFIKNPSSIKRETIKTDDDMYKYLISHGVEPISRDKQFWIFLKTPNVSSLLKKYTKGGGTF
ncbi:MAG: hypothetical protein ACLTBR_03450 [Anaerostipes sp.]|uniref:hypothetical protein n=1 Tax=Anaerostipes sp. TaxID=1872530 RepID=UPI00399241B3